MLELVNAAAPSAPPRRESRRLSTCRYIAEVRRMTKSRVFVLSVRALILSPMMFGGLAACQPAEKNKNAEVDVASFYKEKKSSGLFLTARAADMMNTPVYFRLT